MSEKGDLPGSVRWTLSLVWRDCRLLVVSSALITFLQGVLPAALALTARGLIDAAKLALDGVEGTGYSLQVWLAFGFFVALAEALSLHASKLVMSRMRDQINTNLNIAILKKAARKPLSFFEDPRQREMVARARRGASGSTSAFMTAAQGGVTQAFQAAGLISVLAYVEPLVLVIVGPVALPYLIFQWRLAKSKYDIERNRTLKKRRTGYFTSLLTNPGLLAEVKVLDIVDHIVKSYEEFALEFKEQNWSVMKRRFSGVAVFSTATVLVFYAVFFRVVLRITRGTATLGDLAIFGGASVRLRMTLERAISQLAGALEKILYINDLREFLSSSQVERAGGAGDISLEGKIEFVKVSFTYPGSSAPALRDFSLTVYKGESIALAGHNGAGKTTFVKLLAGLYDPDEGEILIDGKPIGAYSLRDLRRSISVVMQQFGKYEASAYDNLAYGDWERLRDRPDLVREIAGLSGVKPMIEALPEGFDTLLGKSLGNHELSQGQWQSLAVARAFARPAPIVVLDEPTASLDAASELKLYSSFSKLTAGRTTILISHRFSTIAMADRIAVMENGRRIELGTHQELMAAGGEYASLYRLHARWMEEGNPGQGC